MATLLVKRIKRQMDCAINRHLMSVVELLEVDYFPNQLLSGDVGFQSFSACYYFTRNILRSANSWSRVARFVQPGKGP